MFDIGFTELLLVAVVALVVLGPERLPKAARFAGLWVRRARAQWYSVRSELERELAADELKRSLQEARQAASELHKTMQETEAEVQLRVSAAEAEARREIESLRRQVAAPAQPAQPAPAAPAMLTTDAADGTSAQDTDTTLAATAAGPDADDGGTHGAADAAARSEADAGQGSGEATDGDDGRQR